MQFEELFDILWEVRCYSGWDSTLCPGEGVTQITVGRGHGVLGRKWCVVVTNSAVTTEF